MSAPSTKRNNRNTKPSEPVVALPAQPPVVEAIETGDIPELKTDEIARLAHSYWEARGCQGGSADEDWLRAEQELRARK